MSASRGEVRVGVFGLGTIGTKVASALSAGGALGASSGLSLAAVTSGRRERAEERLAALGLSVPCVDAEELATRSDVVVDCAPKTAFRTIAEPALRRGRILVTVSGAALLASPDLVELARREGGRIVLASGAILGLDALRAAAEGEIRSVTMITRKPPRALAGAPYVTEHGIDLDALDAPTRIFEGTAEEGARGFPANVNVAAAVGLAGIGAARTKLEIWADPSLSHNTHRVRVEADSARFEMAIENVPSEEHPGTGRITALSVVAALRDLVSPLRVGT